MKVKIFILAIAFLKGSVFAYAIPSTENFFLVEKSNSKNDKKKSDKEDSENKDNEKNKDILKEKIKEKLRGERDKKEGGRFGDKRFYN